MPIVRTQKNDSVATPADLYNQLNVIFHFNHDPCPIDGMDGLNDEVPWGTINFVNPPYSDVKPWLERGLKEKKKGNSSVFLIPLRPTTKYWNELVFPNADQIFVFRDKVKFEGYAKPLPLDLSIVVFRPEPEHLLIASGPYRMFCIHDVTSF